MHDLKKSVMLVAKLLIAAVLITWLIRSGRLDFSVLGLHAFGWMHLAGLFLIFASMLLQCVRWWWLVRALGIDLTLPRAIQLSWIGVFFSLILPGATSGELVRGYYIMKHAPQAKMVGASTVLMDRIVGLYALLCLGVTAFLVLLFSAEPVPAEVLHMGLAAGGLLAGMTVFLALLIHPFFRSVLGHLLPSRISEPLVQMIAVYHSCGLRVAFSLVISLGVSTLTFGSFLAAAGILGIHMPWQYAFLVGPLVIMVNCLPVSPGGIGVGEAAASVLFGYFGIAEGASLMLMLRVMLMTVALPGGILYAVYGRTARAEEDPGKSQKEAR